MITVSYQHYLVTGQAVIALNGEGINKRYELRLSRHEKERCRVVRKTIKELNRLELPLNVMNYVIHQLDQMAAHQREWCGQ